MAKQKHPGGRPPKFETPEELQSVFEMWKQEFEKDGSLANEIPDVEGFCDFINSYRDLFSEYEKKEKFSDTVKRIKNWIYYRKKQLAMSNKMNAAIFIFDAKNNAGYADKTENETTLRFPKPLIGGASVSDNDSNQETPQP